MNTKTQDFYEILRASLWLAFFITLIALRTEVIKRYVEPSEVEIPIQAPDATMADAEMSYAHINANGNCGKDCG